MNLCGEVVARASRPRARQRGRDARATICRFMESPHDFFVAHWDHEPGWTISCRICNTNLSERFVRFMGSLLFVLVLVVVLVLEAKSSDRGRGRMDGFKKGIRRHSFW